MNAPAEFKLPQYGLKVSPPVVTTIHFADHGQDFLSWGLCANGIVRECFPMQGWVWNGHVVINPAKLKRGATVEFIDHMDLKLKNIRYAVAKVERVKP